MMRVAALRTVVRVEDLRLVRLRRALADALTAEEAAQAVLQEAEARVDAARGAWAAADADFRGQPQCEQRKWLRELANERLLLAVDTVIRVRSEFEDAAAASRAARMSLLREEERAAQLDGLHRSARKAERDMRDGREEEDRVTAQVDA